MSWVIIGLAIAVLFISVLGSISGVGGGVLYVPLFLTIWTTDSLERIKYISTFLVFLGSALNVLIEIYKKRLSFTIILVGLVCSTISILIGNKISTLIGSDGIIKIIVACTLLLVTFMLIYSQYFLKASAKKKNYKLPWYLYAETSKGDKINILLLAVISFVGGIITSLTGMGGGPIIMPLLIMVFGIQLSTAAPISHSLIMVSSLISLIITPISSDWNVFTDIELWTRIGILAISTVIGFVASIYLKKIIKKEIYIKWLLIIVIWISTAKIFYDVFT